MRLVRVDHEQPRGAPDRDRANTHSEQFLVIAKGAGRYSACAQDSWPVATGGTSCRWIDIQ